MYYTFRFEKCQSCGKEFLVERTLIGIDHTASMIVSCKECLQKNPLPEPFIKGHPEEAKNIMKWLEENREG